MPVSDQWSLPFCGPHCSFIYSKMCRSSLMLSSLFSNVYLFILAVPRGCGALVPHPEIEPTPHAVGARSPNHWAPREVPGFSFSIKYPIPQTPWRLSGRESTSQFRRHGYDPWVGKIPGGGNGNCSSTLAWNIPWTEEPGGLQSMGLQSRTRPHN